MEKNPNTPSAHQHSESAATTEETSRGAAYARFVARVPQMISRSMQLARPLAYASEVGESFRHVFPYLVKPLYALSIGYVVGDIGIKYYHVQHKNSNYKKWFLLDLSLWHLGASLVLPAVVINRYIHTIAWVLKRTTLPIKVIKYAPTVTGLCLIPFIVHPLDHFTDWAMDESFRKYVNYKTFDDSPITFKDQNDDNHHKHQH
jgi:hypothetical protein